MYRIIPDIQKLKNYKERAEKAEEYCKKLGEKLKELTKEHEKYVLLIGQKIITEDCKLKQAAIREFEKKFEEFKQTEEDLLTKIKILTAKNSELKKKVSEIHENYTKTHKSEEMSKFSYIKTAEDHIFQLKLLIKKLSESLKQQIDINKGLLCSISELEEQSKLLLSKSLDQNEKSLDQSLNDKSLLESIEKSLSFSEKSQNSDKNIEIMIQNMMDDKGISDNLIQASTGIFYIGKQRIQVKIQNDEIFVVGKKILDLKEYLDLYIEEKYYSTPPKRFNGNKHKFGQDLSNYSEMQDLLEEAEKN